MPTLEHHVIGAAGGFTDTYLLTLAAGMVEPGDVVVVRATQNRDRVPMTVTGLGGTWQLVAGANVNGATMANAFQQVWVCRDATATGGTITVKTPGLFTWHQATATVIAGLTSSTVAFVANPMTSFSSGSNFSTPLAAGPGQLVLATADASNLTAPYPGVASTPAAGWVKDAPVATAGGNRFEGWLPEPPGGDVITDAFLSNSGSGAQLVVVFGDVVLPPEPPYPPMGLLVTPAEESAHVQWDPPISLGGDTLGYTVQLDAGPVVDVGYVLEHELLGLTPGTLYMVTVRAYGPGGTSDPTWDVFSTLEPPPPPPPGYYRTWVELGPHTYTGDAGTPPELGVALPLSFGWTMADDAAGYPAQHEVGTASLLLVVASGDDIAGLDVGTPMRVRVWDNPAEGARPVATFTGRVADYEIEPHERGIAVRLLGADYTADLAAGGTVGGEPWPEESGDARAARIMAEHGSGWVSDPIGNVLEERAGQPAPAANVLRETLTAAARPAAGAYTAPGRVIVTPQVNAAGELEAYRGTFVAAESTAIDKVPTAVHRRTSWRRNRITDGRWVHIDHPGGPTVYGDRRGTPRPRVAVPVYDTTAFAELVLAVTPGFSWLSGAPLRLDLQHPDVPLAAVSDWLWRDPASPPVPGAGRVVVVSVCDAMPGMFTTYAGVLAGVQFTLEPGGRRYIDFKLRPDVPAYSTVTPRWVDEPAGATWADELPAAEWYALRTVLRADYLEHLTP